MAWEMGARRCHPTLKFSMVNDRNFTMKADPTNTNESIPLVLQLGSDAEVLKWKSLQDGIKRKALSANEELNPT